MKALQSKTARAVLADPKATAQLRAFLASKSGVAADRDAPPEAVIEVQAEGRTLRLRPMRVPKASSAS